MGSAKLFFHVIAATAPLLLAAQTFDQYSPPKPPMLWINSNAQLGNSVPRPILIYDGNYVDFNFAAGFVCATTAATCDAYLFAVFFLKLADQTLPQPESYPPQVIWSANRDHLVGENATLEFTSDGNLVLCDADGSHVWSSGTSGRSVTAMVVNGNGSLMLSDQRKAIVWQSFDHPTDTLVLGQSLVEGMRLTASTSATNTTESQFYITVSLQGLDAYYAEVPTRPYLYFSYRTTIDKLGNDPTRAALMDRKLSFILGPHSIENITLPVVQSPQYMKLDSDGHLRLYEWSSSRNSWTVLYDILSSLGMDACDYPTVCGEYGICTGGQCACPLDYNSSSSYFKPVDERIPNLGCTPITPISCKEIQRHQLLTLPNISYFDTNYMVVNATNIDDCKQACLKNCSCTAVMFIHQEPNSYYGYTFNECQWVTKISTLQSAPDFVGRYYRTYLKVQLAPSISVSNLSNSNKKKVILVSTLGALTTVVVLFIAIALHLRRRKYEEKDELDFDQLPGMPTRFSFEKLSECTEGFSKKLGEGGFGSVFEGKLGEIKVAVKRLEGARQGKKEFLAEVESIGSIEHINLVSLIGFCAEKSERLLVYEYMSRGSLDRWIYKFHNNAPLDWCTRCRIIIDVAKGLCYLHEDCRKKIVHLDIKPQNILLDDNFNAKVADFGLCKLIDRDQSKVMTMMRGTPGYLAPEWLTSRITEKVDVYSFGVVIMEILSGRKNIDNSQPEENVQLINLLREKAQKNQLIDMIDKHGEDMISHQEEVVEMMKLAIWCLQHDSIQRPSMSIVIKVLEGAISIETFDANSLMFVQDNPSTYSVPPQASIVSGPR